MSSSASESFSQPVYIADELWMGNSIVALVPDGINIEFCPDCRSVKELYRKLYP